MPKLILVVDDEPVNVAISKAKLKERGYDVLTANNGIQALEALHVKIPDLILLDVEMPEMNGYTFIMEKSKKPDFDKIPVIMLTSHDEIEPLFRRHKIKGYLLKPIQLQVLLTKVEEVIGLP